MKLASPEIEEDPKPTARLRQRFWNHLIRFCDRAQARSPPISPAKLLSSSVFLTAFGRLTCATELSTSVCAHPTAKGLRNQPSSR